MKRTNRKLLNGGLAAPATASFQPYDKTNAVKKLKLFIAIVSHSHQKDVLELLKHLEVGMSFITHGHGTGTQEIYEILGLGDNRKDLVFAVIKAENAAKFKAEMAALFARSRDAKGVAFAIDISSVIGVSIYKYLTNTRQ